MKNLTQLPGSGKSWMAKNDNTLGLMRGGIRSKIGSMSLKNTSLFGVILALMLTLGVGEMWGMTFGASTIYFDNTNANFTNPCLYIWSGNYNETWQMTNVSGSDCYWTYTRSSNFDGDGFLFKDKNTWTGQSSNITDNYNSGWWTNCYSKELGWKIVGSKSMSMSNTTETEAGSGTSGSKYIVKEGTKITVSASGTKIDANHTVEYKFNDGSWSTTNTYTVVNSAVAATDYNVTVYVRTKRGEFTSREFNLGTIYYRGETKFNVTAVASPVAGGSVTPPSNTAMGQYTGGTITASENTGYTFTGWTGGTGTYADASEETTTFKPTAASTVTANFSENMSTVTLTASPSGKGSFTIDGAAATSTTAGVTTTRSVTAVPISGYRFSSWSITGGASISSTTDNPTTVTGGGAGTAATLTANFVEDVTNYRLKFGKHVGSEAECTVTAVNSSTGAALTTNNLYLSGTGVTVTATCNDEDYKLGGWYNAWNGGSLIDAASTSNPYSFTLSAATNIYAHYVRKTTSITLNKNGGSGGTAGPVTATHGSTTLSTNPLVNPAKTGYTFTGYWTAASGGVKVIDTDGTLVASVSGYTKSSSKEWDYDDPTLTLYAQYSEKMTTVTVNVSPAGAGTLTVDGGVFTPGNTTTAGVATSRTVVATAGSGKVFLDWTITGNATGSASTNTYTLNGDGSGGTGTLTANFGISSGWNMEGEDFGGWNRPSTYKFVQPYRGMSGVYYIQTTLTKDHWWKVNNGSTPFNATNASTTISKGTIYDLVEEWGNSSTVSLTMNNVWVVINTNSSKKIWVQDQQTFHNVDVSNEGSGSKGTYTVTLNSTTAFTKGSNVFETTQFADGEEFKVTVTGVSGWIPTITIGGTPTTFWQEAATYEATGTMSTSDIAVNITYTASRALTFSTTTGCATLTATGPGSTSVTSGTKIKDGTSITFAQTASTGYSFSKWYSTSTGEGGTQYSTANSYTLTTSSSANTIYPIYTEDSYTVTLDVDEDHKGTIAGATPSQTVYYGTATVTIPHLPTAATGYGLDGYYTDHNGAGTKVINGDGTWIASVDGYTDADKKWIHADNVTLYAYYKQAEITELTLVETIVGTAETDSITVTPVIAPLPAGTTIVCWEVQYSNGTALPSQPEGRLVSGNTYRFKAPTASATYRIQATLRSGADCGGGSVLSTRAATFQVAGDHTVTVQYKCGDLTLAASSEVNARPLEWSDEIVAPDITGYTFSGWVAGDGVTIKDGESSTATTHIKAVYDGTLTAVYNKKNMIFFNNTLGWKNVYVYFYSSDKYWVENHVEGQGCGTGSDQTYEVDGSKAYYRGYHGHMTQIEGTNIWYYDYEAEHGAKNSGEIKGYDDVVFVETEQNNYKFFHDNKASRRGDFKHSLSMFVPLNSVTKTKNGTKYYNDGYWMNYPENTGYTLKIYNYYGDNEPARTYMFPYSADLKMPLKLDVEFNNGEDFWFSIYRNDGVTMGKNCEVKQDNNDPQIITNTDNKLKVITSAPGTYSFTLSYTGTNYYIDVDYPASVGDYRILYKDNATWAMGAHDGSWEIASDVINKNSGSEVKNDTVSFFVSKGNGINVTMKFQEITDINGSTGVVTWGDVAGGSISIPGSITEAGVYNFIVSQPAGGSSISLEKVEPYTGNYYIRTDCAGNTKWNNYKTLDHHMTYSDYAENNSGYSHYYAHWVTSGTNVKFCIANDYSMCLTEQLSADYGTTIANIDGNGTLLSGSANIRFMWNQSTNKLSRAYIAGSGNITDRFLVLEGDAKMYDENGNALTGEHQDHNQYGTKLGTDNQVIMHDKENFVYERTIQVNTKARARLSAAYNGKTQYFIGSSGDFAEGTTVELLGGAESDTKYTMRIVYDFKTNRLVTAYMPSGAAITEPLAINADIMLVREHQNAGQQLTFEGNGSLSAVKTVYGVMRFNRWTLNNKSTAAGHAPVGDPKSTYERSLYWISFPFDVNLSDVFGFGTYGTHWIIEYYDGAERATEGYWADSEGFWKYVTNRNGYKLEAGKGYILALDLDLMRDNNKTFWAHNIEQVELFFPSAAAVENIQKTDTEIDIPAHECTITARPGMSDDRTKKDSHWNIIGVPSYANYGSELKDGSNETINWNNDPATKDLPFLYEWNMVDNTYSVQSGTTYPFKSMHAYMVQYNGKLKWSLASATPVSPVIARQTDAPKDVEFRIELQAGEKVADQTFVKMSTDEQISTAFDFNYDLSKQMNSGKANIYTMVEGYIQTAGNCLPMSEQTTVVPVGVKIAADGDYTFAIPEGTAGIGVTLIDTETGIRTNLSALTYTIALTAGTYDNRFVLEFSPIRNVPTEQPDVRSQKSEVSKVLIDGLLYIVRDNKMYDARGAMIMEK